ncbi:MAG: hypothetical protein K8W52_03020 [Deltaproteobacteria bacterium]|nr:hypothetical protein [Deltaproteobacteria bacterium]
MQYRVLAFLLLAPLVACGDNAAAPGTTPDAGLPSSDASADAAPGDPATGTWRGDFGLPGVNGDGSRVEAIALAGNGDVYVGGIFSVAAGVAAQNIAVWNRTEWAPVGAGLDGWVHALRFDGAGHLWAGVQHTSDGTGAVATWDGAAWTEAATDGAVLDLAVVDATIVAVGRFTTIDGVAAQNVAVHDATGWHAVGDGTVNGEITAVAANGDSFCVAGAFDTIGGVPAENVACRFGAAWVAWGKGLPGGVSVLARTTGGTWYAGGTLTFITDPKTGAYAAGIARLEGSTWVPLDGGIDNGFINEVRAIAFDGDDVLVGGCFGTAGATQRPAASIARWSPISGWSELAGGVANDVGVFLPEIEGGNDFAVDPDGSIWIGGLFTRAGGTPAVNIANATDSAAPTALVGSHAVLGVGGFVDGLAATPDGHVIAGGGFAFAGQTPSAGIARFEGAGWADLGNGLRGIVRDVRVRADGSVAVAGQLVLANEAVAFVQSSGAGWTLPGGAVHGQGFALLEVDGALWLGGDLSDSGATPLHNLARLDGTTWSAQGNFDDRVNALAVHGGDVVAGGLFTMVDGASIPALAQQSATGWSALGAGIDGSFPYVLALADSPTLGLVVGGQFDGAGGVAAPGLVRWDGAWHDVGGGITSDFGFASALRAYGGGVFVAGGFEQVGTVTARNLAWFDGTAWHELGGGLGDLAEAMVVVGHTLYVGGPFTTAGGAAASGFASWTFAD